MFLTSKITIFIVFIDGFCGPRHGAGSVEHVTPHQQNNYFRAAKKGALKYDRVATLDSSKFKVLSEKV